MIKWLRERNFRTELCSPDQSHDICCSCDGAPVSGRFSRADVRKAQVLVEPVVMLGAAPA